MSTEPNHAKGNTARTWLNSGWPEAAAFVLAISTLNVVYAIAEQAGAHVTVFVIYATSFAAIGMLLISGLGQDWRAVIAARQSWLFGITTVAMEALYYLLVAATTPAEASLLMRLAIPASILIGWLAFSRNLNPLTLIGCIIILASVIPVFFGVPWHAIPAAMTLTILCSLVVAAKTFTSEFHPWNQAAETVREKLRVTGLVVLTTGIFGLATLLPAIAAAEAGLIPAGMFIPPPAQLIDPTTIGLALLVGAPVFFAMNYLTFSAVVKIGTESFLATSAFTPFSTLALQMLAVSAGVMIAPTFEWWLTPLVILGIVGVILIIRARHG